VDHLISVLGDVGDGGGHGSGGESGLVSVVVVVGVGMLRMEAGQWRVSEPR
jgi:hypothetical protein